MWFGFNNAAPIALDVGSTAIRAIQMERNGNGPSIREWLTEPLVSKADAGQDGPEIAPLEGLAHTRPGILKPFAGREVVTLLGPPDVEVCSLHVPSTLLGRDKASLIRNVGNEVERHVHMSAASAEIDLWPLPPGQSDGPNIMVAAAPRAVIERLLAWIRDQGCVCRRIDLAPLAIMRGCARIMDGLDENKLWGVLDIGLRSSRFYVGWAETPVYVRSLRASGDLMTRRIVNELSVELEMAERYKRHFGIRAESGGYRPFVPQQGGIDGQRMSGILLGALSPIIRGMAEDIEKSFRYAMDLYPSLSVGGLVLMGGGSSLEGLPELLGKLLEIPVRRVSADRLASSGPVHPALCEDVLPGMVACLGLGYGELDR